MSVAVSGTVSSPVNHEIAIDTKYETLVRIPRARLELPTKSKLTVVPGTNALAGMETATELFEFAPEKLVPTFATVMIEPIRVNESVIPNNDD